MTKQKGFVIITFAFKFMDDYHIKTSNKTVGLRQVLKSLNSDAVQTVVLAADADDVFKRTVTEAAAAKNVPLEIYSTKQQLAKVCGVDKIVTVIGLLSKADERESAKNISDQISKGGKNGNNQSID